MTFRFSALAALCAASLLLSACATEWTKPGGTGQMFDADNSACTAQAAAQFPPLMHPLIYEEGYTAPVVTQCTHSPNTVTCTQSGGDYVQPSTLMIDDNLEGREAAVRSCLYKHGWTPTD